MSDPPTRVKKGLGGWHRDLPRSQLREAKAGPALREAVRASQSRMIHRRLKGVIDRLSLRAILPKSKLGEALRYAANQWNKLEAYLGDGRIKIDNNLVENAIRPIKLGAKNWLFIGCREAALLKLVFDWMSV